jgi:hypothetical protein
LGAAPLILTDEGEKVINESNIDFCDEFYVVEKTVEVVAQILDEPKAIRIEALRSVPQGKYSTRAYIQECLTVQPTYPQTGSNFDRKPEDVRIWVDYDLPWTDGESADEALNQALSFLKERCSS